LYESSSGVQEEEGAGWEITRICIPRRLDSWSSQSETTIKAKDLRVSSKGNEQDDADKDQNKKEGGEKKDRSRLEKKKGQRINLPYL